MLHAARRLLAWLIFDVRLKMRVTNRCIPLHPGRPITYLVDANFLVYHIIDSARIADPHEKKRAERAEAYWSQIEMQRRQRAAKVFVLDVCIAEAFKVLAKLYYKKKSVFPKSSYHTQARLRLQRLVKFSARDAAKSRRTISFHDIQTTRDIVIGVDRFFERSFKDGRHVGIIDLLILSTARYLIDFIGLDREELFLVTMDGDLYDLARSYAELPACFNPDRSADDASRVFSAEA